MNKTDLIERYEAADRDQPLAGRHHASSCWRCPGWRCSIPSMFFLTNLFGGGPWTRILHPFIGVVMFAVLRSGWRCASGATTCSTDNDRQWLSQWRDVIDNREDKLPEVGRYNAGQKVLFWVMVACLIVLLFTGFVIWRPYFAPAFTITLVRIAVLLHAIAAFVLILGIIVHIYAAIWVKGSVARHDARLRHTRLGEEASRRLVSQLMSGADRIELIAVVPASRDQRPLASPEAGRGDRVLQIIRTARSPADPRHPAFAGAGGCFRGARRSACEVLAPGHALGPYLASPRRCPRHSRRSRCVRFPSCPLPDERSAGALPRAWPAAARR